MILNPSAHGGRAGDAEKTIPSLSPRAVLRRTEKAGDAGRIACDAVEDGFSTLVVAGGDGTINEVVNGLPTDREVTLGILPVGTMNVFASELGLPLEDLPAAWQIITEGSRRLIDLPRINDQHFVQLAGVGLDAEVVRQTSPESKRTLGPFSYLLTLVKVAAERSPAVEVLPVDGPPRTGCFVLVGNGRFYGGPFVLFPEARMDDGLLDILVFQNQGHWDLIRYVQAIAFGNHTDLPDVEYFQTRSLKLRSPNPVSVEIDGEWTGSLPCEIEIPDHQLSVLTPTPPEEPSTPPTAD